MGEQPIHFGQRFPRLGARFLAAQQDLGDRFHRIGKFFIRYPKRVMSAVRIRRLIPVRSHSLSHKRSTEYLEPLVGGQSGRIKEPADERRQLLRGCPG